MKSKDEMKGGEMIGLVSGHFVVGGLEFADDFLERLFLGQSDGLGSLERFHVVGDDFVLFGELHDSGLVIGKTVVGALGLNLKGRQLLGHLIVLLVGVLSDHLGLLQLLLQLLATLGPM